MILILTIAYTIIRHRLLDIRVVITRSLIFGILVAVVALGFTFVTILSAQFFSESTASRTILSFVVAIIIVAGIDPLKRALSVATDRVLFKAKIDYGVVLRQASEILSIELNLDRLTANLTRTLREQMKIQGAFIALKRPRGPAQFDARRFKDGKLVAIPVDSPLGKLVAKSTQPVIRDVIERQRDDAAPGADRKRLDAILQLLDDIGAAVVAPIIAQQSVTALLLLGPKLSGESYSSDDLELVEVLSPQLGSAVVKANLYEEVRAFGERLQRRVDEATAELKERNVSLITLQQITKQITRSLDFTQVVQKIADDITDQLGYLGAVLVFVDDDGKTIRARAITQSTLTKRAMKLLPVDFTSYSSDLTDPAQKNLGLEVIRSGQIRITERFADVVSPPLPKLLADGVQKVMGIKTMVAVPITAEEKVIGAMEIGLRKSKADITNRELDTMQSIADQLGIVARNLRLFEQLKQANAELEDANRHLQQLDQAKSEFVSIASHQLRTPMTGIAGYLSMMTAGDFGAVKPEHGKILKNLLDESRRMIRLINLFLNVSKIEAGKFEIHPQPTDIVPIIEKEVSELTKAATEKGLSLAFQKPAKPLPSVMVDQDKIQDVLLNLIDNAIKYTTKGSVTVTTTPGPTELVIAVKDTGVGIPQGQAGELFNKFVRGSGIARVQPDGSGLGLFIAKRIVEAHHGRIWVTSDGEGKGSTFSVGLPLTR